MLNQLLIEHWLSELLIKLKTTFGPRLLLVVHVGSWARDDANDQSDIDVNVILDQVGPDDLISYRKIVSGMPHPQMACGFLGGLAEIKIWPRYELTAFYYGTRVLYGNLAEVVGPVTPEDLWENALVMLSNINHAVRHAIIYDAITEETAAAMKGLYKAAFFVIRAWYLLTAGEYVAKRKTMISKAVTPEDMFVLEHLENWDEHQPFRRECPLETLARLETWSTKMFERLALVYETFKSVNKSYL